MLLHSKATVTEVYHFALPGIALSFLLLVREWGMPRFPVPVRIWQIGGRLVPLLLGALVPVIVFLMPYISSGTVGKWFFEVLILPVVSWQVAFHAAINPVGALCAIPPLAVLALNAELRSETGAALPSRPCVCWLRLRSTGHCGIPISPAGCGFRPQPPFP